MKAELVRRGTAGYPPPLDMIADPPSHIWVKGDLPDELPGVAIVGTRRATRYGLGLARAMGAAVARAGWPVISGLARGVDGAAHRGCIDVEGVGVAVLGSGIDVWYPPEHRQLGMDLIGEGGAVLSEYPADTRPDPWRFPAGNSKLPPMRTAVYARISRDPEEQSTGVDRQLVRGREAAEANGWHVAATYVDNDMSGYQGDRPGFDEMCQAIEAGEIEAVIVQHQDRLARNVAAFRRFADLCLDHDVRIETWSGPVDTATASGRFTSTIQAATDEHYSALISEKARAAHADIAARGEPNGGRRPFGYNRVTVDGVRTFDPHQDEAPEVVTMFDRFLAGAISLRGMAHEFNDRGIPTAGGSAWTTGRIRDILANRIYAGLRVHRGEIVGAGNWPALVDRETSEAARAILDGRRRRPGHNVKKHYLAGGLARCGVCGGRLVSRRINGRSIYSCLPTTSGGCGKIVVDATGLEDHVSDIIVMALTDPRIGEALERRHDDGNGDLMAELDAIERRRTSLAEAFAMDEIDRAQLKAGTARLDERRDEIRAQLTPVNGSHLTVHDLAELWESEKVEWRHQVAATLIEEVVVNPATRGLNHYDPRRVEIVWQT